MKRESLQPAEGAGSIARRSRTLTLADRIFYQAVIRGPLYTVGFFALLVLFLWGHPQIWIDYAPGH